MKMVLAVVFLSLLISPAHACPHHRSRAARAEFMHSHPCPANGHTKGACPGYVVDHIKPLACGGSDAPSNMQWQTVAAGKAKDRWELSCKAKP